MIDSETFKLHFLECLNDKSIASKFCAVLEPVIKGLRDNVESLTQINQRLNDQLAEKDRKINALETRCDKLETTIDNLEQYGRRGSMRIQGLPEDGTGTVEDKILKLCNEDLKLQPPLQLNDIEVAHRLPRRNDTSSESKQDKPLSVIVKFISRRVKTQVIRVRKDLKDREKVKKETYPYDINFQDDLTETMAKIAFKARNLKRADKIQDTWVWDSKILVKDEHNRIHSIKCMKDLSAFGQV